MFSHLLVPLDGSALAETVLPVATALARRLPARISILHVVEPHAPPTVHGDRHLTRAQDAEAYLDQIVERLAGQSVQAHAIVRYGSADVAKEIAATASAVAADLTVLCTHGSGGVRGAIFGSVAQQVLQQGKTPVLLTRPVLYPSHEPLTAFGFRTGSASGTGPSERTAFECRRILVPLDGSETSETALPAATEVARAFAAQVLLLSVVPTPETAPPERAATRLMPSAAAEVLDLEASQVREYLHSVAARLAAAGVVVTGAVERGDAVRMLLQVTQTSGADLIVMATHGRSGLAGAWAGSVASRVIAGTMLPVLLVRIS